ncbi:MAG: DUF2244 domain-containing protein [Steroidobacteraceae bacterium]|nr:DUF2244 domain-containing protein [Steroidobacteraceae bacterium]
MRHGGVTDLEPGAAVQAAAAGTPFRRIELLPNCSLSVRGAWFFFGTVAFATLTFAFYFVAQGFWPVLPWAGLELGILGWALWATMRRRRWTQTITVTPDHVEITTRGKDGERRIVFSRHWAAVTLRRAHGWHPSRLVVESHGNALEVGSFLTEEERRALHRRLAELIGRKAESPELETALAATATRGPEDSVPGAGPPAGPGPGPAPW